MLTADSLLQREVHAMSEQITFNRLILKSADKYLGFCPELNVAVSSDSPESARDSLAEGVRELLETAKKDRQLEHLLNDAGFSKSKDGWTPPAIADSGTGKMSI
jgi:hypothetical protein